MIEILTTDARGRRGWVAIQPPVILTGDALNIEAVKISDPELAHAQILFGDSLPMVYYLARSALLKTQPTETGSVTWFGDHARFIVANWR